MTGQQVQALARRAARLADELDNLDPIVAARVEATTTAAHGPYGDLVRSLDRVARQARSLRGTG